MEATNKKSTNEKAQKLLILLEGYKKCDPDFLDRISDISGFPVDFIFSILKDNPDETDIDDLESAVSKAKEKTIVAAQDTTVGDLIAISREETDLSEIKLPPVIYTELGQLISTYSSHYKTKTVYLRDYKLQIAPGDAFQDGGKDTFEDNGIVAQNYIKLLNAIVDFAREVTNISPYFPILAELYQHLTTMSDEACNQQNAIDLATVLEKYTPSLQELQDYKRLISQASNVLNSDIVSDEMADEGSSKENKEKSEHDNIAASEEVVATEDVQQRATLPDAADDEEQEVINSNIMENKIETNAEFNAWLQTMFAWELIPKWLQDDIINSTLMQIIFQAIAEREAIYNPKSIAEKFAEIFIIEKRDGSAESAQDNRNEKAVYTPVSLGDIDTSYIYTAVKVGILILPMVGVSVIPDELQFFGQIGIEAI